MGEKEYLSLTQRELLLEQSVISLDFITASGKPATQKFEFDRISSNSELFQYAITGLARCIQDNFSGYDGILTVAKGATRLGDPLSKVLETEHIGSSYYSDEDGTKHFSVHPKSEIDKVVLVDDVFTRGTNTTKVALAAEEQQIKTIGIAVLLDRSGYSEPSVLGNIPIESVIQRALDELTFGS